VRAVRISAPQPLMRWLPECPPVDVVPPTPTLLAGAGASSPPGAGPSLRRDGHVGQGLVAAVVEDDVLVLPRALQAVRALGYAVADRPRPVGRADAALRADAAPSPFTAGGCQAQPETRFVGLHGLASVASCPLLRERRRPLPGAVDASGQGVPFTIAYTVCDPLAAALHRVHGCADLVVVLYVGSTEARFAHVPWPSLLDEAQLTAREAEVLALLVERYSNAEIAETLVLSQATVRAHCRAVYRKLNCSGRRALHSLRDSVLGG